MPTAEIIAIGTELLLGEIQDSNTRDLAIFLKNNGIDLYRATIVGDNVKRIANAIQEATQRSEIVITTGGLGPTIDDPTREAVALSIDRRVVFIPDLWEQIQQRFKKFGRIATSNNKRQAYIPDGSIPVENAVGTAPAFIVDLGEKVIISLPGVPRELHYLLREKILPFLKQKFELNTVIKAKVLHSAGMGESQVDELISDLETWSNPTVGLLAHPGQVDIRITAKAEDILEADRLIEIMRIEILSRLGEAIYGEDGDTLESVVIRKLSILDWFLTIHQEGLDSLISSRLNNLPSSLDGNNNILEPGQPIRDARHGEKKQKDELEKKAVLYIEFKQYEDPQTLRLRLTSPRHNIQDQRSYGGPPALGPGWALNQALDFLRRHL